MKSLLALTSVLALMICAGCGGGDSRTSLEAEAQTTMTEFVAALDGVKDEASAKAAKPKLKTLIEKLDDLNKRQAKLPAPSEDEIKALDTKYGKQMEDLALKLQGNMMRIAFDPKIRAELEDIDMKKAAQ
jgi:hypothetical protein